MDAVNPSIVSSTPFPFQFNMFIDKHLSTGKKSEIDLQQTAAKFLLHQPAQICVNEQTSHFSSCRRFILVQKKKHRSKKSRCKIYQSKTCFSPIGILFPEYYREIIINDDIECACYDKAFAIQKNTEVNCANRLDQQSQSLL